MKKGKRRFEEAYDELSKLLVEARRKKGLTQTDLAYQLDQQQTYISKVELQERRLDLVEFLILAETLDVDVADAIKRIQRRIRRSS